MTTNQQQPNVLFFLTDQHRHDWLGTAGSPVQTPNIDKIADQGVRFTNAVCPSPLCAPSRACLATGVEYTRSPVKGNKNDLPVDKETYYELLRDRAGYHVTGCGKFDLHKASYSWGTDGSHQIQAWGFSDGIDNAGKWDAWDSGAKQPQDPYMAYLHREGIADIHIDDFKKRTGIGRYTATHPTALPEESYCDNWIARNGLDLLDKCPYDDPWHLVVNFAGPHEPMDVTEDMHEWYRGENPTEFSQPINNTNSLDRETYQEVRRNYSAMVENVDRWLGTYLDRLEKRGELSDTVIVFASDHGELLGDHGYWGKHSPYRESVRVPLIMAGPEIESRELSNALVSLIDLAATFLNWADVECKPGPDTRSLDALLRGDIDHHRDYLVSELQPWQMVYDGRYKLITNWDPTTPDWSPESRPAERDEKSKKTSDRSKPVLYDLGENPEETVNIVEENPDIVSDLQEVLCHKGDSL